MQVGKDRAAPILRSMREQEVAEIMAEVARLHHLELHEIEEVMSEFRDTFIARAHVAQGGYQTARELLESSFGGNKADEILDNLGVTMVAAPSPARCSPTCRTSTPRRSHSCSRTCIPTRRRW